MTTTCTSAHAALNTLSSALATALTPSAISTGAADPLVRANLALLALPASHVLDALASALQHADDLHHPSVLVLVRAAGCVALDGPHDSAHQSIRLILLPLLARSPPALVVDAACDRLAALVGGATELLAELRAATLAALGNAAPSAPSTTSPPAICLGAVEAAALAIHLQRAHPSGAYGGSLIASSAHLALALDGQVRSASLAVLAAEFERLATASTSSSDGAAAADEAAADDADADADADASPNGHNGDPDAASASAAMSREASDAAGACWSVIARGCARVDGADASDGVRAHCFRAACALHSHLQSAWRQSASSSEGGGVGGGYANCPQRLLLSCLEHDVASGRAISGSSAESKAAAFIVRAAFGGGAGAASLGVWDRYLEMHSALDAYDLHLITPIWQSTASDWWVGDGGSSGGGGDGGDGPPRPPPAWDWIAIILRKAFAHANVGVRYWAATNLLVHMADAADEATRNADATADRGATDGASASATPIAPPPSFILSHLLPLLLSAAAPFRLSQGDVSPHHIPSRLPPPSASPLPPARPIAPLAAAVARALPAYLRLLLTSHGLKSASSFVTDLLRTCVEAPKQLACAHILAALAVAPTQLQGVLSCEGMHALRDLLHQANRSHSHADATRLWRCGVGCLIALATPATIGLLPLVELVATAPAEIRLLDRRYGRRYGRQTAGSGGDDGAADDSADSSSLSSRLREWLAHGDSSGERAAAELTAAVASYLDRHSCGAATTAAAPPTAADLIASATEAGRLAAASSFCTHDDRLRIVIVPACELLARVHTRMYLHPLSAPRALLLVASVLSPVGGGLADGADASTRDTLTRLISASGGGMCGFGDVTLAALGSSSPAAMPPPSASSTSLAPEEHREWLCARAVTSVGALASIAALVPEVPAHAAHLSASVLPALTAALAAAATAADATADPTNSPYRASTDEAAAARDRISWSATRHHMIYSTLHRIALAYAAVAGATTVRHALASAARAVLASSPPTSDDAAAALPDTTLRLLHEVTVARWVALDSLLAACGESAAATLATHAPPVPALPALDQLSELVAGCGVGDDEAVCAVLRVARRLQPLWLNGASPAESMAEGGGTVGGVITLHQRLLESIRLLRATSLQPAFLATAADCLLSPCALTCPALLSEAHAAFDHLLALGTSRPFAARIAAARTTAWCEANPTLALPWATRLHALLLHGEKVPKCGSALTSLDEEADLSVRARSPSPCTLHTSHARPGPAHCTRPPPCYPCCLCSSLGRLTRCVPV